MKRHLTISLVVLLAVFLLAPAANAAKKGSSGVGMTSFDVAVDFGLPIAGFFPYGSIDDEDGEDLGSISGMGNVSFPYLGLHGALYPDRGWYIQFDFLTYQRQSGEATLSPEDEDLDDQDFDFVVNRFMLLDAGLGKVFGKNKRVRPKAGAGLGVHYMSFFMDVENGKDESASGWAIGPFGQVGVDVTVTKIKKMGELFVGGNLRLDLIWNWQPYEFEDSHSELSTVYLPLSAFLSTGLRF